MMSANKFLSNLTMNYPVSGIRAMFDLAADYPGAINLCNGEPNFETPEHIKESCIQALREGRTKYGTEPGLPAMRQAVANKYTKQFGRPYDMDNVMVTIGGVEGIFMALMTILNPGDEVIIPDPAYTCYVGQTLTLGGVPVRVPLYEEHGFRLQAEDLEKAITPKTKAIVITYPSNPLGAVLDRADGEALAKVIEKHNIMVISDEVYEKIIFDGREHFSLAQIESIKDKVLVVNSLSKTYAMTGWRLGYCMADTPIRDRMQIFHQHAVVSAPSYVQPACVQALKTDVSGVRELFRRRRDDVYRRLTDMGLEVQKPEGAFYVMMNLKELLGKTIHGVTIHDADDFADAFLKYGLVATVPCTGFGAPDFVRWSYATSMENIDAGLDRLEKFLAE